MGAVQRFTITIEAPNWTDIQEVELPQLPGEGDAVETRYGTCIVTQAEPSPAEGNTPARSSAAFPSSHSGHPPLRLITSVPPVSAGARDDLRGDARPPLGACEGASRSGRYALSRNDNDDTSRVRVHIEDDVPRVREATDEALRCVVADFALAYSELSHNATRIVDGLLPDDMLEEDVEELVNRVARALVAWWFVAKTGAALAEQEGIDNLEFSQRVDEVVSAWVAEVESRGSGGLRLNGAAQESNLPSVGLPRLTGFEGLSGAASPLKTTLARSVQVS